MVTTKKRNINNAIFYQGRQNENNVDGMIVKSFKTIGNWAAETRTSYKVACAHDKMGENYAGNCAPCTLTSKERTLAVMQGHYSISWTESIPGYGYCARYANDNGKIIKDVFKSYSKPEIECVLQCLMSNPADLHPIFIAEDSNLFWPIIWYYGSVYNAISECCNSNIVNKVYGNTLESMGMNLWENMGTPSQSNCATNTVPDEILSAFPESATNQLRIACGNEKCPQLDHQEKFKKCSGCRVRYYCKRECQLEDFKLHKPECKEQRVRNEATA